MKFTIPKRHLVTHLFFICFFLVLPTLAFQRLPGESVFTVTRVIAQDTIANFILLCFFYLNYYLLIPKYYFKRKYFLYVIWVILFLIITFPLPHLIGSLIPGFNEGLPPSRHIPGNHFLLQPDNALAHKPILSFSLDEFSRHLYLFFTAVFFSFLLRTREHLSKLKEDKLNAELTSLKAQINPHFLFNTLNSIYALSVKKDDKASEAIIHLAGLMRYVIKDANDNKIALQKEIDYITNYIELQKARLGNTTSVSFTISGEPGNKRVTPLILITYIENAFKYGVNPDVNNCSIDIQIEICNNSLKLLVFNKKVSYSAFANSAGIGMNNTKERLVHLYPQKYNLEIKDEKETYTVKLRLDLL